MISTAIKNGILFALIIIIFSVALNTLIPAKKEKMSDLPPSLPDVSAKEDKVYNASDNPDLGAEADVENDLELQRYVFGQSFTDSNPQIGQPGAFEGDSPLEEFKHDEMAANKLAPEPPKDLAQTRITAAENQKPAKDMTEAESMSGMLLISKYDNENAMNGGATDGNIEGFEIGSGFASF